MKLRGRLIVALFLFVIGWFFIYLRVLDVEKQSPEESIESAEERVVDESWKPLNATRFTQIADGLIVQFSYDDHRVGNMGPRSLRVFMFIKRKVTLSCHFATGDIVQGTWYEMAENHGQSYGGFILSCEVPPAIPHIRHFTITEKDQQWVSPPMEVDYVVDAEDREEHRWQYSICSPLIYGTKYKAEDLIEWVEMNRLLGVDHISLYIDRSTVGEDLLNVLGYYAKEGFLDAVQLHPPVQDVWYHGQLGMITDCLLRHTKASRFVSFQDVDEIIASPTKRKTVDVLIEQLIDDVGSVRIPTEVMSILAKDRPHLMSNIQTDGRPENVYTKCVLRPHMVFEQGIHHTSRVIQDHFITLQGKFADLRVMHFRSTIPLNIEDRTLVDGFGDEFTRRYSEVVRYIERIR